MPIQPQPCAYLKLEAGHDLESIPSSSTLMAM
jgi:hypothetical protein